MTKLAKKHDEFRCGFATALSILQSAWGQHGLVVMILNEAGFTYSDLRDAGAADYDLKMIRDAFRRDGKKVTRRGRDGKRVSQDGE